MSVTRLAIDWTEQGLVPDGVIRAGIRRLLHQRLVEIGAHDPERSAEQAEAFVQEMARSPIAILPGKANEQHYEVPAELYELMLGPRRKYSCCHWAPGMDDLQSAEDSALAMTCERAQLADGMRILELGCGWGSLTVWMAERFPTARILAVSNSRSQRQFIEHQLATRGLSNASVVTCDMNEFDPRDRFDRVVSVEMFEHMRNWNALLTRIHSWLLSRGRVFLHVFAHRTVPYAFEPRDAADWMSRHFFSGGLMPSDDLLLRVRGPLELVQRWRWDGTQYQRTANAWLARLDANRAQALRILSAFYGASDAALWLQRWRMFFMACAELFGYDAGREWWVSHYLLEGTQATS